VGSRSTTEETPVFFSNCSLPFWHCDTRQPPPKFFFDSETFPKNPLVRGKSLHFPRTELPTFQSLLVLSFQLLLERPFLRHPYLAILCLSPFPRLFPFPPELEPASGDREGVNFVLFLSPCRINPSGGDSSAVFFRRGLLPIHPRSSVFSLMPYSIFTLRRPANHEAARDLLFLFSGRVRFALLF